MTNGTEKAYRERNRLMVLAAVLAMDMGHRAGRYRDPEATEERFAWVVQLELLRGQQVTMHVDADDSGSGLELLPVIERDWDGHDAGEAFARVAQFVASRLSEIGDGLSLRALLEGAIRRAAALEHGAMAHIQATAAELERERRESARLRSELRDAREQLSRTGEGRACDHKPPCRHEYPRVQAALCDFARQALEHGVSVVIALVQDGDGGPGVDGVTRTAEQHHGELTQALSDALRGAALQVILGRVDPNAVEAETAPDLEPGDCPTCGRTDPECQTCRSWAPLPEADGL